jgi:hypothetical protein
MFRCRRPAVLVAALLAAPLSATAQQPLESPGWVPIKADEPQRGFVHLEDSPLQPAWQPVAASDPTPPPLAAPAPATGVDALFRPGATSSEVRGGAYYNVNLGPRIPAFNYVPVSIRQGLMLTCPTDHFWGYGNYECLLDLTGAAITSTYGHYFVGPSFYLRANWITGTCAVPYFQLGTGAVWNDAFKDQSQRAIGEGLEFYQHVELGLKYFVAPNMSLDLEGGLQHLSNGGLARRNFGMNALGATVGFTYYLPTGQ